MKSAGLTPEQRKAMENELASKRAKKDEEKQRILEQAEADRKARVEKNNLYTSTGEGQNAQVPTGAANAEAKSVKLQIRCPHFNRVAVFTSFTPETTLNECACTLREELIRGICESEGLQAEMASARVPTTDTFVFVETVPPRRRWVSPEDMRHSLRSAGLCPSSSLLAEVRPLEVPQSHPPESSQECDENVDGGEEHDEDEERNESADEDEQSSSDNDDDDGSPYQFGKGKGSKGRGKGADWNFAPPQKGRHRFPQGGGQVLGGGKGTGAVGGGDDVGDDDDDEDQSPSSDMDDDYDQFGKGKFGGKGNYAAPPKRGHQFPEGSGQVLGRGDGTGAVGGMALAYTVNSSTRSPESNNSGKESAARDARLAALERRGLASSASSDGQESLARQDPNRPKGQMGDGLNKEQRNKERDEIMQRIQEDREFYEIRKPRSAPVKAAQEEEELEVRLQVRCATSRRVHIPIGLKKDSLLCSVRDMAAASLEVEAPVLSLDYPPWTQFEDEQYEATLSALNLCPSATLRISSGATPASAQQESVQCP